MAGLPWLKVWTAIGNHPKVQRLEKELGVRDALGIVIRLWCWAAEYHPGGDVPSSDSEAMGRAAAGPMRLTASKVVVACVTCGWLDPTPEGFRVHDWHDMQTTHVEAEERRKVKAAVRQANYRARHGVGTKVTAGVTHNVTRDVTRDSVTEKEREIEKKEALPPATPEAPAKPSRAVALRSALVEAFEVHRGGRYAFVGGRDGTALKALMALTEYDGEILNRWKQGLSAEGWKQVNTIGQLLSKWNDLTAPAAAPQQQRAITHLRPLGAPGA